MNDLMFKNVVVEMIVLNGVPYFNPYHVGVCLGLSNSTVRDHIANMNSKQVVKLTNSIVDNTDFRKLHNTGENFLTESGVYKLIFKSNKEQAEEFQNWVTDDVLPMIRQTGVYISEKERLQLKLFSDDKGVVVDAHKKLIQLETKPLLEQLEEQAPDVAFAKAIGKSSTLISIAELSNLMSQNGVEMGRNRLFEWLRVHGYLVKQKGPRRNLPTQRAIDLGILKMIEDPAKDYHGNPVINKTTMVTPKGQRYFLNKFLLEEKKGA
ncbi:phage antirepressor KilAC domain-containing protein [Turicibacter sanguinis]|uniref:phage antirepressor KilAC domain-containing protein n=1 Tax=Turicibacter sanguinis TaxID=154288 RepID=UPI0021D4DD84|nr:phage antirepressor KilAC domain-containing protein [Turicibacter sanguinis]MCU7200801.1 phage antirepressor KilAC domain-containing protein [Turicibacter sanguinis]